MDPAAEDPLLARLHPALRLGRPADGPAVARLVAELGAAEWASQPPRLQAGICRFLAWPGPAFTLLIEDEGVVLAFVMVQRMCAPAEDGVQLCIDDLYVSPAARGRGLARALVAGVRAVGARLDCCYIYLHVRADNHVAQQLYASEDFEPAPALLYDWCNFS